MVFETALGRIIAGALLLMDVVRSCFVVTNFAGSGLNCDAYGCGTAWYTGSLTSCGRYIADMEAIEEVFDLLQLILPALGVAQTPGTSPYYAHALSSAWGAHGQALAGVEEGAFPRWSQGGTLCLQVDVGWYNVPETSPEN